MAQNVNADAFVPEVWEAAVHRTLENNLVAKKIVRTPSKGDITGLGDTIYFNGLGDPTISTYTGSISYETLDASQIALLINQHKSGAFKVTDIEEAMSNVDLQGSQTQRLAYGLANTADAYIFGLYADAAAGTVTDTTCDTSTIFSDIGLAAQYLSENNVPEGERWLVIPPWVKLKLQLAGIVFEVNEGLENGTGGMAWAKELGFTIYVSNNLTDTASTPVTECLAGSYNSIVFADKLLKTRAMELESSYDVGVSSLYVYGAEVVKSKELARLTLTYAAETAV